MKKSELLRRIEALEARLAAAEANVLVLEAKVAMQQTVPAPYYGDPFGHPGSAGHPLFAWPPVVTSVTVPVEPGLFWN